MHIWQIVILVFSGLGIFNSLAFIIYLNFPGRKSVTNDIFLQIVLFAFILQIFHALIELFHWEITSYYSNLYLLGTYVQGPAIYLLIKKALHSKLKLWPKQFVIHFAPYILLSSIKYDFQTTGIKEWIAIYLVGIQYLVYVLISVKPYIKIRKLHSENDSQHFLIIYLFPVFALLWMNYPLSGITGVNYQLFETILHSCFVYYLIFLKIREKSLPADKYKFTGVDSATSLNLFHKISDDVREKELYLDADITLSKLARKANLPVNTVSQAINQNSGLNFRDFINSFRIEKAKEQLAQKINSGFTISGIAFDYGFNSLSAFNRAFKKATGITPSEYIKANIQS